MKLSSFLLCTVVLSAVISPLSAAEKEVTLEMIHRQEAKVARCKEVWRKADKHRRSLEHSGKFHAEEAAAWDSVSRDLNGLTSGNERTRLNEHRKAHDKMNRANIIDKQRVAPLKHAYDRENAKLKAMIKEYNSTHRDTPYGKR